MKNIEIIWGAIEDYTNFYVDLIHCDSLFQFLFHNLVFQSQIQEWKNIFQDELKESSSDVCW